MQSPDDVEIRDWDFGESDAPAIATPKKSPENYLKSILRRSRPRSARTQHSVRFVLHAKDEEDPSSDVAYKSISDADFAIACDTLSSFSVDDSCADVTDLVDETPKRFVRETNPSLAPTTDSLGLEGMANELFSNIIDEVLNSGSGDNAKLLGDGEADQRRGDAVTKCRPFVSRNANGPPAVGDAGNARTSEHTKPSWNNSATVYLVSKRSYMTTRSKKGEHCGEQTDTSKSNIIPNDDYVYDLLSDNTFEGISEISDYVADRKINSKIADNINMELTDHETSNNTGNKSTNLNFNCDTDTVDCLNILNNHKVLQLINF